MNRARWTALLRLAVSALLIWFLLSKLSLGDVRAALADPRWGWLAAGGAVFLLSALGGGLQWGWILRAAGIGASWPEIIRIYFVGLFFNNILPANVGGDAVKIVDLGRRDRRSFTVFCGPVLDRVLGLCALTLLALVAVGIAAFHGLRLPTIVPLLVAMALWLGMLTLLLSRRLSRFLAGLLRRLRWEGGAARVDQFAAEFRLFRTRMRWLAGVFGLACAVQALRILTHVLVARGLGFDLAWQQTLLFFVLVPLLGVLIALPVSINGIGMREVLSARFFVDAGVVGTGADGVAIEFAAYLVQVAVSLAGGVLFLVGRRRTGSVANPE